MRALQPEIFISRSQHKHLKKVIAEAFRNRDRIAPFLGAEVRRAALYEDKAMPADTVSVNRQVSYRLDWGTATPYRTLVYPEDMHDEAGQISILSPIGTALLGLRRGDQMLVFLPESGFHKLYVEGVRDAPELPAEPADAA
jgi:regulator of nucleoside diphosphate kinase